MKLRLHLSFYYIILLRDLYFEDTCIRCVTITKRSIYILYASEESPLTSTFVSVSVKIRLILCDHMVDFTFLVKYIYL